MQINVSGLLKESVGSTRHHHLSGAIDIAGETVSEVTGEVTLTRTSRGILVSGTIHTEVTITCSRCLSPFSYPLTVNFEEEYFPVIEVFGGTPLRVPDELGAFVIDEHHVLDLVEAVRQYALLAIPMKPLCRDECAGICPGCGHNLNGGACGCSPRDMDPRWYVLRRLVSTGWNNERD